MRIIITLFFLFISFTTLAQTSQGEYLEAKRQYALGNYAAAQQAFSRLTEDQVFGPYASFYYALSALRQDQPRVAYDMWKQIQLKYPEWDQQDEVDYWMGYVAFTQEKYWEAFKHIEHLPTAIKESLIKNELEVLTVLQLKNAHALNPNNAYIAKYLAKAIMELPYDERDQELLASLDERFDLKLMPAEVELPTIKKPAYNVAAVLPFMFDSLENPQTVIRNAIIFDMYQGMLVAQKELEKEGIALKLFPFDTKKKGSVATELIASGKLDEADVIIGPLYGGPNRVISNFSKDRKISMINPLSSNEEIVGDNPYAYLLKPSYSTQGRIAADYAIEKFQDNKKAFIFYETDRDSLVASAYLKRLEQDSFFIIRYERMTNESAQQVQKDFIETYEVRLDTIYSKNEIDSIALIPGRYVKTRPIRDKRTGRIIKTSEGQDLLEYYENRFLVKEDSIGHIFAATSSNLLANNFISLSEVRSDTIGVIGYEDWLDFSLVSYDQLERLSVAFISPGFIDVDSKDYAAIKKRFITHMAMEPGEYHLIGYELIMQLGRLMGEHGVYFQKGLINGDFIPGKVMGGLRYGTYHDNQVVPITRLENLRLINLTQSEKKKANED